MIFLKEKKVIKNYYILKIDIVEIFEYKKIIVNIKINLNYINK